MIKAKNFIAHTIPLIFLRISRIIAAADFPFAGITGEAALVSTLAVSGALPARFSRHCS
jgi:hypothetical protein